MSYVNSTLNYRIPLRPHLGCLGLYPANADNFKKGADNGTAGTSTTAPSKFGGNLDDWRIGAGKTAFAFPRSSILRAFVVRVKYKAMQYKLYDLAI